MHRKSLILSAALAACCSLVAGVATAQVKPGDVINRSNIDKVKDLVSPGVRAAIENGSELTIVPYQKVPIGQAYRDATEKYAGQATVDDKSDLKNWVAGRPFPTIDPSDPKAAVKVMWNFNRTSYFTDDFGVHLPDAEIGRASCRERVYLRV